MTPKFVRLIQNWSGHISTSYKWRLVLFYVKMDYSSEEGDAKNGNLVEETYEYLVRNVHPVGAGSVGSVRHPRVPMSVVLNIQLQTGGITI